MTKSILIIALGVLIFISIALGGTYMLFRLFRKRLGRNRAILFSLIPITVYSLFVVFYRWNEPKTIQKDFFEMTNIGLTSDVHVLSTTYWTHGAYQSGKDKGVVLQLDSNTYQMLPSRLLEKDFKMVDWPAREDVLWRLKLDELVTENSLVPSNDDYMRIDTDVKYFIRLMNDQQTIVFYKRSD